MNNRCECMGASTPMLAVRRCRWTVLVLRVVTLRGRRFTATCHQRWSSGRLHNPVYRLPATPVDVLLQVPCGVEIPIQTQAAMRAGECPLMQGQFGCRRPSASRTGLGAGKPAIDHQQVTATPAGLVVELTADLSEPGIGKLPSQPPVLHHPSDIEVLQHHRSIGTRQPGSEFVQVVAAQVRHSMMDSVTARVLPLPAITGTLSGPPVRSGPVRRASVRCTVQSVRWAWSR